VIALAGLVAAQSLERGGQVVMAGDPWQLGPIVRSSVASDHGLATSLLERLMALPLYSRGDAGYDVRCITKLVRNFRSHPALLRLPGRLFYADELVPCADRSIVDALLQFSGLTEQGKGRVPLLVHGVVGQDMRESTSPSFFNPVEAALVLDYVGQLVEREGVRPSDIGVIAPYRQQVNKLREALGRRGLRQEVMVGTTEEFQGQERLVIIVSTVRSSPEYLVADSEHRLGFLANPKRFNVAITRARGLLIVIGNPHILERDPDWRELLEYALGLGCYRGVPFPRLQQPEEQEKLSRWVLLAGG
jgi:superfamily I DNA and/or RNA helicase